MNRRWFAFLVAAMGLAYFAVASPLTVAQDRDSKDRETNSSAESSTKVDKTIRAQRESSRADLDQTRKDVDRLRKELCELANELRVDMAISLAEFRAEINAQDGASVASEVNSASSDKGQSTSDQERSRRRQRAAELHREFRQIQDGLRNEVRQAQGLADQAAEQLRALRAQQRAKQQQVQAERERIRKAEEKARGRGGAQELTET